MEDCKGGIRWFKDLDEEIASLAENPVARSLLEDLKEQAPERVECFLSDLTASTNEEDQ